MHLKNLSTRKAIDMSYLVHSTEDRKKMLEEIGISDAGNLFNAVPKSIAYPKLNLPAPLSEKEIKEKLETIGAKNKPVNDFSSFLGGGAYNHYIPAAVRAITGISEFYTAYTPYQAEISQGTLQYIFEFQSFICRMTGMDIANASMYDGASSLAEAALMAARVNGKRKILLPKTVNPEYRMTCRTYLQAKSIDVVELDYKDGKLELGQLEKNIDDDTAAVIIQNPNFFGCFEEVFRIREIIDSHPGCLFIAAVEPVSLGLIKDPASYGADIATGDGQALGNPLCLGGPYLGFFACREKFLRQMPGRIAVKTIVARRNEAFVLSFQTREQHIRKSKATSNICSNHSLNALAALVYLSIIGKAGLRALANICLQRANYLAEKINSVSGFRLKFKSPFFNEFVVETENDVEHVLRELYKEDILGGVKLENYYPGLKNCFLVSVTEMNSVESLDRYHNALSRIR